MIVRVRRALVYANAERAAAALRRAALLAGPPRALLVDCAELALLDHTAALVLARALRELRDEGRAVVFYRAGAEVARRLRRVEGLAPHALDARCAADALRAGAAPAPAAAAPPPGESIALLTRDDV